MQNCSLTLQNLFRLRFDALAKQEQELAGEIASWIPQARDEMKSWFFGSFKWMW